MTRPNSPLSITGIGLLSAAGAGVEETRRTLFAGHHPELCDSTESRFFKFSEQPQWRERFSAPEAAFTPNLFALLACDEALESAGLDADKIRGLKIGVCLGSTAGCSNYQEAFTDEFNRGNKPPPGPLWDFFRTNTAQFISRFYGLQGPVLMLNNACTSGADAIAVGAGWLNADLCDAVICGGTEAALLRIFYGFRSLMLCSPVPCKPFDRARQGLTLGEGAGIFLLEKKTSPRQALARYLGYGSGSDAFHPTSPHPDARGLQLAVDTALQMADLSMRDIGFINAHATGTSHNDLIEGKWINKFARELPIVATKGFTGHTLGASGGIEAVLTVMGLLDQNLPGSRGFSDADPEIGLTPTTAPMAGNYSAALSFSLGFGGTNAVLCLGQP